MLGKIKSVCQNNKVINLLELFCMVLSLFCITNTDSYTNVYVLCFIIGIIGLIYNKYINKPFLTKRKFVFYIIAAFLFSICIVMSNYQYLLGISSTLVILDSLIKTFIVFVGCICIGWNSLCMFDGFFNQFGSRANTYKISLTCTALICFFSILIIDLIYLFVFEYPGNLSQDSINQMNQVVSNTYSNHHPFFHTILIKACFSFGMLLFDEINAAVACYSVFQILFMATCFTYCVVTLYQMKVPSIWIVLTILFFTFTPYHIAYSITMWKDIPFAGAVLLLITALYRIFMRIGKHQWINLLGLIIGSMGMCLWRTNGWIAFALTLIVFLMFFLKEYKRIAILFSAVIVITFIMIHPILALLNIKQPDTIESLSIPVQQISRVVVDDGNISTQEYNLLNNIIETNKIPEVYKPYISDPIKELVRKTDKQEYLPEHKSEYLKLWIAVGLKNPRKYLEAWVDQTKGYWNGGYSFWIWGEYVLDNSLGIKKSEHSEFDKLYGMKAYIFDNFCYDGFFDFLRSAGLCTWIIAACGCIALANKYKKRAFLVVPLLAIILTLCIATPVFCEFRYVYALFTCAPMIICTTFYKEESDLQEYNSSH